jgi:tetratricopeptide (TPR) repeat protein
VTRDFTIRKRVYLVSVIFLLGALLFMVTQQFMADFFWRIAQQPGKQVSEMMSHLEKCVAIDDENPFFHFSLGRAYLHKGFTSSTNVCGKNKWVRRSIDEFHRAISLEPVNSDYHFHLGISYGSLVFPPSFYWREIHNSFRRVALLNPTDVRHLYSMGLYYLNEYRRVREIDKNSEESYPLNYGEYVELSRDNYQLYFRKLLNVNEEYLGRILENCFSANPKYTDLKGIIRDVPNDHAVLARFLDGKKMWKEAEGEYREAINLEPNNPLLYFRFAHALYRRGCYADATYWWRKQKALDPRDERPYLFSADSFVQLGRFDDALGELQELVSLYPNDGKYMVKLIRTFLTAGRMDEAIEAYRKITARNPHVFEETYERIRRYRNTGNDSMATKILSEALLPFQR